MRTEAIGKSYPPTTYAVGREKVREFAAAVGETNPLHLDPAAARAAGHADVVAPPMFVVVYQRDSLYPAMFDPEVGIDFPMLVHSAQDFRWERVVVAGEELTSVTTVAEIAEKSGMGFYAFEIVSRDERGDVVASGVWRMLVRGREQG